MSSVLLIGKETDTVRSIAQALAAVDCHCERASGAAGAIRCLRQQSFDVVITDPDTTIDEGLALIEEMNKCSRRSRGRQSWRDQSQGRDRALRSGYRAPRHRLRRIQ